MCTKGCDKHLHDKEDNDCNAATRKDRQCDECKTMAMARLTKKMRTARGKTSDCTDRPTNDCHNANNRYGSLEPPPATC